VRICYVAHSDAHFTPPYVDYFAAAGHEVHLVSLSQKNLSNAINHHPRKGDFDAMKASWAYVWAIPKVRRVVRRIKPDIVHAHYLPSNGMMAAMAGVHPLIVTAHGSDVHYCIHHVIKRHAILLALRRADLVNAVSRDLERKILSLGLPAEKVFCLTLGIDTKRFICERGRRRPGPTRIICTRRMGPVYQCGLIVEAAADLAERGVDFELTFGATGPEEPRLRQEVERRGLQDCVTFLGGYALDSLPALLADSDICVSASRSDGTSLSLLEAMAAGAFPVVSDIVANREWLTGDGDSLLFDVDSREQLARCLELAITDSRLRQSAVEINRQRVLREGDRETNMKTLALHYERLVRGGRQMS